jgi:hypothetical protein
MNDDCWTNVMYFLPNYDIFNMTIVNKNMYNLLNDDYMYDYIKYRPHPATFNTIDNFCLICNFSIVFLCDPLNFDKCLHC